MAISSGVVYIVICRFRAGDRLEGVGGWSRFGGAGGLSGKVEIKGVNERVDDFVDVSIAFVDMCTVGEIGVVMISGLYVCSEEFSRKGELEAGHGDDCISLFWVSIDFGRVIRLSSGRGPICLGGVCGDGFGSCAGCSVGVARDGDGAKAC